MTSWLSHMKWWGLSAPWIACLHSARDLIAGRHDLIWRASPGISSSFQSGWKRSRCLLEMVANLLSNGLLLVQLFAALALGKPTSSPLYKDPHAPVEKRVKDLLSRMTIEDKRSQLTQGMVLSQLSLWAVLIVDWFSCRWYGEMDEWNHRSIQLYRPGRANGREVRHVLWYVVLYLAVGSFSISPQKHEY